MFKKFVCIALSLMMVLCTVSVTGFAASYESGDLVASNVVFSDAADASGNKTVTAQINVSNNSASENGSAVFWVGKYDANGVLVEAAKQDISLAAGENKDASAAVSLASDETGYSIKAYIWEKMIGGKAIATAATYNSSSTEILYAMAGDEVWEAFDENTLEYDIELERTQFDIPEYKLFAKDNATKVTEPAAFVLGENKITVTSGDGSATKEYKLNISYKAPEFANFNCAGKIYGTYPVQNIDVKFEDLDTMPRDILEGTDGWSPYPGKNGNAVNSPGKITTYLDSLGYNVGELFVFKTDKGPGDAANYYKSGIGKYDGTDGGYFMTFDIEKAGTMYLLDKEGKGMPNATKEGYTKVAGTDAYKKHYEAGETVKVPSYGWDDSWVAPPTRPNRYFMNSTIFMFGYDAGWEIPDRFDTTDATLKTLKYTADGAEYDVDGFDPADAGEKVYDVVLPYGTKDVTVAATKNEGHATVSVEPETIALTDGKATAKVTVVSFDKTVTNTYTINFTTDIPADSNADLKALEYKYGDSDYVSVDSFDAATDTYSVTLPEKTKTAEVRATAYVFDKATVEITQPVIENYKATATVKVTAADGATVKTYTINFTVELAFEERPNKIYNLTAKESYKTDNHGYQTDAEAVGKPDKIVIGENLSTSSQRYYDRTNSTFSGFSSDMAGASYIRLMRNYHGMYDVATSGTFKRNGVEMTGYNGATGGFRKFKYDTAAFYSDEYTGIGDADGWVEFNVTSDCTVVLGDVGNFGYPNANLAGWTKVVDNTKNYLGCASYYKTFNAGDRVKIPSYGKSSGKLADKTPVVYEYTDKNGNAQVFTTTLGYDSAQWDAITVAIKWGKEVSQNANLSSIKVDGAEVEGFTADKLDYTVMVDKSKTSVSLEAVAADSKATVDCPATINVGSSATITVTAEDKTTVKTYTVTVKAKESNNAMLSSLKYAIGSAAPVDVEGFDASAEGGSYTVAAFEYSKTPIVITLSGTAVDEEATISTTPVTLSAPGKVEAVLSVTSADTTVTKEYKVTFEMLAKVASAVVESTDEYKALFNDGQFSSGYNIVLADPVSYEDNQTSLMLTWDENGRAKNRLYEINVDGTVYTETQLNSKNEEVTVSRFKLSKAKEVKAAKEAEGKTVTLTAKDYNYEESKVVASRGSAFNLAGIHNFGAAGAKIKTAMQVMTSREIAPGRINPSNATMQKIYKNPSDAIAWLKTDGNYVFTVTPNTKATVYVTMAHTNAKDAKTYKEDGWTFLDYSAEFTRDKLNAFPEEAIIEAYRNLPTGITRQWFMVEPSFTYPNAPFSLTKMQYDVSSDTVCANYPYVWYKTVEEDETLKVPTIGSISPNGDQAPLKAFVLFEEHDSSLNPASGDATLKSITIGGTALEGFAADKTDYTVDLPYGSTIPEVEAAANDAGASVAKNADGNVVKITVTAKNGTVKTYTITFNIKAAKTDATLKSISVGGAALEGFAADKIDYTVERAYGDSVVPEVTYEVNDADATAVKNVAGDVVTIEVTAQDGATTKTYTITFTNKAPKTDATLKSISVNGTAIADFAADKYEYTVKLPYGSETQIGFELNDNDAKGTLKKLDTNVFAIEVTAQDGVTTKTYKITLDIESAVSTDATLKSLIVGGTPITLEDAKFEYECTLIDGFVKVVAVANHAGATVTIADADGNVTDKFYGGTAVITVKAADNTTTNIYKVIFKSGTPGGIEDGGETGDGLITDITGSEDGGDV